MRTCHIYPWAFANTGIVMMIPGPKACVCDIERMQTVDKEGGGVLSYISEFRGYLRRKKCPPTYLAYTRVYDQKLKLVVHAVNTRMPLILAT